MTEQRTPVKLEFPLYGLEYVKVQSRVHYIEKGECLTLNAHIEHTVSSSDVIYTMNNTGDNFQSTSVSTVMDYLFKHMGML